jgi:DNA polymerase III sliding clamp (beta) subunit (PCNA family)
MHAGSRISFVGSDGTCVTSSLLTGDYPDLSVLFPKSDPVEISFNGECILDVLGKHGKYQRKVDIGDQEFSVTMTENQCTIVSESEMGMLQETLEMGTDIGSREIGFYANPVLFDGVDKDCTSFTFYPEDGVVMFTYEKSEYLIRTREG